MAQDISEDQDSGKRTSEDLAVIVIDALLRARIVQPQDVEKAIAIALEEILAAKIIDAYRKC